MRDYTKKYHCYSEPIEWQKEKQTRRKRINYIVKCTMCGTEFKASRSTAKYCCGACRTMAKRVADGLKGTIVNDAEGNKLLKVDAKKSMIKKLPPKIKYPLAKVESVEVGLAKGAALLAGLGVLCLLPKKK